MRAMFTVFGFLCFGASIISLLASEEVDQPMIALTVGIVLALIGVGQMVGAVAFRPDPNAAHRPGWPLNHPTAHALAQPQQPPYPQPQQTGSWPPAQDPGQPR